MSGCVKSPTGALAGVGRPQVAAVAALQMDERALVAQQVLPMGRAILDTLAVAASGPVVAAGAGQPCAPGSVGGWVNR